MNQITKFAIVQVDRDPETGAYGENDTLILQDGTRHGIGSINENVVTTTRGMTFELGSELSDMEIFNKFVVQPWEARVKSYLEDEDFTDYWPAIYVSVEDVKNNNLLMYAYDRSTGERKK